MTMARRCVPLTLLGIFLLSFAIYSRLFQHLPQSLHHRLVQAENNRLGDQGKINPPPKTQLDLQVDALHDQIERLIPNAPFTFFNRSTSAKNSKAVIANPRKQYCVGEDLVVRLDMYDYLDQRKTYGGDFLRPRLFSPDLGAAVSGVVEDFGNGSYNVRFPLYWSGSSKVSILVFHPSEGVAALWRARHASLGVVGFHGKFEKHGKEAVVDCSFQLEEQMGKEICEYTDPVYEEAFYCYKVPDFTCESLNEMSGYYLTASYLTDDEKKLFQRSNIAIEIPTFEPIMVSMCTESTSPPKPKCQTGMGSPYPSGYYLKNNWNPIYCNMTHYKVEDLLKCLKGKNLFLIGDSTLRQFIMYFTEGIHTFMIFLSVKSKSYTSGCVFEFWLDGVVLLLVHINKKVVNYFRHHGRGFSGWAKTLQAFNLEHEIYVSYKRHGFPLEHPAFYYFKEDMYVSRQIDQRAGGKDTIIMISMGQHFRMFPFKIFIKRVLNIRRAIEKLFLRSPDTKVIIKTENTRELYSPVEMQGDFHGYTQYLVLRRVFQGLNVGFVDAWDMTVASASTEVHPSGYKFDNILSLAFSFACP